MPGESFTTATGRGGDALAATDLGATDAGENIRQIIIPEVVNNSTNNIKSQGF
ncbi:hypothetical protein NUACC21_52570 [Scytonema sp. NUACC21]